MPASVPEIQFPTGQGQLTLSITGFRNDLGEALIYFYEKSDGFPETVVAGLKHFQRPISQGEAELILEHFPYGLYAVSVLHDENRNGEMDRSSLGFPQEGFGFSRNPKLHYGPPDFQKVRFLFIADKLQQTIEMQYQTLGKHRPKRAVSKL